MKKLSLVSLACAAALAVCPAVLLGQSYDFTISGSGISATGVLTVQATGNPSVDEIIGISGTYSDGSIVGAAITGLYPDPSYTPIEDSNHLFYFDNLFDPSGTGGSLDAYGMVFDIAGGDYVGMCSGAGCVDGGHPGPYNLNVVDTTGNYTHNNSGVGVTFTPLSAPEGGASSLYLVLAGAVCFGAIFFFSRDRFANLA